MPIRRTIFGVALVVATAALISWGSHKEASLEELKSRVETAKPDDRAGLCIQIAERQVESADKLYTDGKLDEAQAAMHDVVSYSQKAVDAASHTGHKLKNTEIALRRMTHRLGDMKRTLAFENQAAVQNAADVLEKLRTDVLNRMFGKSSK